ncbi:MAG: type ISP restriction/modification enzyme, partial [Chloroflexota bacterium]|nr:type ISP restriction/modification enzyme [Chloroflexota bacterium]
MSLTITSAPIKAYYARRAAFDSQGVSGELHTRRAFEVLLEQTAGAHGWTLIAEQRLDGSRGRVIPDGTLRDPLTLPRGYWEAKDSADDLDAEIEKKFARGYPRTNIIFEDSRRGVLVQSGTRVYSADLGKPNELAALLNQFFAYSEPNIAGFEAAVERFKQDTKPLSQGLATQIVEAHRSNKAFQSAFAAFMEVCRASLNPNIRREAVDEMLIQHLLTERLMRTVFQNDAFTRRNVIAAEVEKVIDALTSRSFDRAAFLGQLSYFYEAIEAAARDLSSFADRQTFINSVYENFFQGYAVKVADTHGIVYTPQPIVDFMCAAVEEVLQDEFDQRLGDPGVCIIDPCTGTGNFIVNLLGRIARQNPAALADAYTHRLFANEVMLLPYYVASLNIEHAYYDLTGQYAPFEGLCFVDTLDLADGEQARMAFMTEANTARVQCQKAAPITVIIGNPPYNVGQINENDNNKNRHYEIMDKQLRDTYLRDSRAGRKAQLYDPYVRFFRWATDRLNGGDGIVAYVSNNSFVDGLAFDGMRKHLLQDFTTVYHIDLNGNVRQNRKISGTSHNVFGIQIGVGITIAVRQGESRGRLLYHRVPELWRKEDKLSYLASMVREDGRQNALNTVSFSLITPDARNSWRVADNADTFAALLPLATKQGKQGKNGVARSIYKTYSLGLVTNRDPIVYDFERDSLDKRIQVFADDYNAEVDRYRRAGSPKDADNFVRTDRIKWSGGLKLELVAGNAAEYKPEKIRLALYRPFTRKHLFFDKILNQRRARQHFFFPTAESESENRLIVTSDMGYRAPVFNTLISASLVDLHLCASSDAHQCFPFYVYDADGTNRRENITDWALAHYRAHYQDESISKWDIFYYTYGVLHQPDYRVRYADNLKRDLPRIPFMPNFNQFNQAGRRLAALHLDYETVEPYPLEFVWAKNKPALYR